MAPLSALWTPIAKVEDLLRSHVLTIRIPCES